MKDEGGNLLSGVDVLVDTNHYQTDEKGTITVNLVRGYHKIAIQNPGYEKFSESVYVRGKIFLIEQIFGNIF